jgi:hypothetical protein
MDDKDLRQQRAAENQSLFREVNERLAELNSSFELLTDSTVFVCECARIACVEHLDILLSEYRRVRSDPRRFFVAPSDEHVLPDVENVVESHSGYFVVEKIEKAAEVAERIAAESGLSST